MTYSRLSDTQTDGQTDRQIDGQTERWVDEWRDGQTYMYEQTQRERHIHVFTQVHVVGQNFKHTLP